jgi:D-sedoheptulose 7-phosphate isomerase
MDLVSSYLQEVKEALDAVPQQAVWRVIDVLHGARVKGHRVFTMGNGGSAATASHFACDLGKGARVDGWPPFRVVPLNDNIAVFSAYANDEGYDSVFARQLDGLAGTGDVVIAFSGSGNSRNVVKAIALARELGAVTVGFVGYDGGALLAMVDHAVHVARDSMQQVEDVHAVLAHLIGTTLRKLAQDASPSGVSSGATAA